MELGEFVEPQPAPVNRPGGASMHDVAAALHALRRDQGLSKYGALLQAANGRDSVVDEVQEQLDGLVYRIQAALERRALADALAQFRTNLREWAGREDDTRGEGAAWALQLFGALIDEQSLAARADDLARTLIGWARTDGGPAAEQTEPSQLFVPVNEEMYEAEQRRRAAEPEQVLSRQQHELMMIIAEQRTLLSSALALLSSAKAVRPRATRPVGSASTGAMAAWDTRMGIVAALAEQAQAILAQGVEEHLSSARSPAASELADLIASFRDG